MNSYSVNLAKAPGWFIAELQAIGVPKNFTEKDLSQTQRLEFAMLCELMALVEKGIVEVKVDSDGLPVYKSNLDGKVPPHPLDPEESP